MKIALIIYIGIGLLLSPIGFFWQETMARAGLNLYFDKIYKLEKAFIGNNERLYVCGAGVYDGEESEFWIFVPVMTMAKAPQRIHKVNGYKGYWKEHYQELWHIPRDNIIPQDCASLPADMKRAVDIRILAGGMHGSYETERILVSEFDGSEQQELVYQLNVTDGAGVPIKARDLGYGNKSLGFGRKKTIAFKTNSYQKEDLPRWYYLVPVAWLGDVLSWPYQLYIWISYADAH